MARGGTVTVMAQTQHLACLGHHGWAPCDGILGS